MKRAALTIFLGVLLLAACGALFWLVAGDSSETGAPRPDERSPTTEPEVAPERVEPGRRRRTEEAVPETPAQMLGLSGRVVAGDAGVPGAVVEAYAVPAADAGVTGAEYAAREMFGHLVDDAGLRRMVRSSAPGGAQEQIEEIVSAAGTDGSSGSENVQNAMGSNMRAGMRLLQEDGAMDRMMRFVRLAQARIEFDPPWPLAGTTTSAADGAFAFEALPAGAVELRVRAPSYVRRKQRVQAGATDVSVSLSRGALLQGQVVAGGQGVGGATVRTRTATVTTDGTGSFRLDGARTPQDTVYVTAPGFMPALVLADVTVDGPNEPVVVTLRPGGSLVGRVVDTSGAPVERATVSSGSSGFNPMMFMGLGNAGEAAPPAPYTQTGADGQFVLEGLAAGAATIRVEREGFLPGKIEDVEIVVGETAGPLDVELERESTVAGRVTDAAGAPVSGATAKVRLPSPGGQAAMALSMIGGAWARAATDAEGRYLVRGLPAGTRDVEVEADGYLTAKSSVVVPEEGSAQKDVSLEAGKSVAGRVTTPAGDPAAGVTVTLEAASSGPGNPMAAFMGGAEPDARATTAADGTFVMTGLQEGPYEITASGPGYLPMTIKGVEPGATDVALELIAGATLRGVVTDALDGKPVGGAWVLRSASNKAAPANPWMRNLQRDPRVLTDANGGFEMAGLEPGEYTLTARREAYGDSAPVVVSATSGETVDAISLVLSQGETLRGRVLTARDEAPIEGALVFVQRADAPSMNLSDLSGGPPTAPADSIHTTTGPSGDFVLEGLTAGTVTVQVRHIDFAPASLGNVEAPGADVVVEVTEGGAVQGYLRDAERRPVTGRQVMVTQGAMGSGGMRTAETDSEGFYRVDRMRPGSYQLMFTDPKSPFGVSGMTTVTLRDGQTVHHDFGPKVGTRPISGAVLLGGEPLEGATVFLTGAGGDMKFVQTGADGRFRFDGLEAGEYTVVVQREMMGGGNVSEKVTVGAEGDVADVRIEVPTLAVSGTVVDEETGDPVAMAQIELLRAGAGGATSIEEMVADTAGRGFTDQRGRFDIKGVEEGTFRVRVTAAGFAPLTLEGVRSGGSSLTVRLGRGTELVVTVLGPDGGPVARANVSAVDASGVETAMFDMTMSGLTGDDGTATLRLGAGRYTIQVDAIEYPPASMAVESQSGAATVRLSAGGTLDISVTDADGKPIPGAEVEVRDASGQPIKRRISMANFAGSTSRTDATGTLQRTGLAAGNVTVVVKSGTGAEVTRPAKIVVGETTTLTIQLR